MQAATTGMKRLSLAAEREKLFMRLHPVESSLHCDFREHQQDIVANTILREYHVTPLVALWSTGDGDCLFNSFSILLAGDERMNIELRYRCCIEMVLNRRKYLRHQLFNKLDVLCPDFDRSCIECTKLGSWASAWEMIALSNALNITVQSIYPAVSGSNSMQFKTLNHQFRPPFADPEKGKITIMWTHTVLPDNNAFQTKKRAKRMWFPNHFVPLVSVNNLQSRSTVRGKSVAEKPKIMGDQDDIVVNLTWGNAKSETVEYVEVSYEKLGQPQARKNIIGKANKLNLHNRFECLSSEKFESMPSTKDAETSLSTKRNNGVGSANVSEATRTPQKEYSVNPQIIHDDQTSDNIKEIQSPRIESDTEFQNEVSTIVEEASLVSATNNDSQTTVKMEDNELYEDFEIPYIPETDPESFNDSDEEYGRTINSGHGKTALRKFMPYREVLSILRGPYVALNEIPMGKKENTYFVINDEDNVSKRANGDNAEYWDDCGAYKKGSRPISLFLKKDGQLINVVEKEFEKDPEKKNGGETGKEKRYCFEKGSRKTRRYVPLDPQPNDSDILKIHYAYNDLAASVPGQMKYKRRVTWVEEDPSSIQYVPTSVAVVEYIGRFPPRKCHGNTKKSENVSEYIRTKISVKKKLKDALKRAGPTAVEREFNNKTQDEFEKQRNLKQLQNMKHDIVKKTNPSSFARKNAADHIMSIENMAQEHDFVRAVVHVKGIAPCVILYTEQQIKDIKRFCCKDGGAILGMDKTYSLGDFHVTPFTYKNLSVVNRYTQDHPITFGPTFIHSSSSAKTYATFLHHIADNFTEQELSKLTIGSDNEYAMKASFKRCFPLSTHVLCTRHLRKNANDYLENTVGFPMKERKRVLDAIFGENGLTSSTDVDMFYKRLERIHNDLLARELPNSEKTFRQYLDQRLVPLIQNHVVDPILKGKVQPNWTSNNCESANHILKSATQWRQKSMPDLILQMHSIITAEQEEVSRAVRGTGNYKLPAFFSCFSITE